MSALAELQLRSYLVPPNYVVLEFMERKLTNLTTYAVQLSINPVCQTHAGDRLLPVAPDPVLLISCMA